MRAPLVAVVTGMPAAGKTTIAEALSRELGLPLISKDRIKERSTTLWGSAMSNGLVGSAERLLVSSSTARGF